MLLVLCQDPLEPSRPDRAFAAEVAAIERSEMPHVLIDFDALIRDDDPGRAARRVAGRDGTALAVYRGWMMTPEHYRRLYDALAGKGVRLINDPDQYRHGHHLPESYPTIEGRTPRSVWLSGDPGIDRIMEALAPFGAGPVIVKDFVKSRKHEWDEACFIPSAADRDAVARVVGRFLELQAEHLNEGLVFREFVDFQPIGVHPRSGMPLTEEHRIFWLDGVPIFQAAYWEEGVAGAPGPSAGTFADVAAAVKSRFFTMDVARRREGGWMIVEIGDGQVSGLPGSTDAGRFYAALRDHWPGPPCSRP